MAVRYYWAGETAEIEINVVALHAFITDALDVPLALSTERTKGAAGSAVMLFIKETDLFALWTGIIIVAGEAVLH